MTRKLALFSSLVFLGLVVLGSLTAHHFRGAPEPSRPPPPADTRDARWRQDLSYLAAELPRMHGNLFHALKREDFEAAVRDLEAAIPNLADEELAVRVARIVALANDAHTHVFLGAKRLPVALYWFRDGIFVVAAHPDSSATLRRRVVRIGGTDIEAAASRAAELVPSEGNEGWSRYCVANLLVHADVLFGLGIIPAPDVARFELADSSGALEPFDLHPLQTTGGIEWASAVKGHVPEYRKKRQLPYWFDYWADSRTLYFEYNSCAEMPGKSFAESCRELFALADEKLPDRIVVDLRTNEGGNSGVLEPFLRGLSSRPSLDRKDRLFVLVGRRTFSSACGHALDFQSSGKATLVGEPTGGNPYSPFREFTQFQLPNSKLSVGLTWKFREREHAGSAVVPELRVDSSSDDYFSGRDPALETALRAASK